MFPVHTGHWVGAKVVLVEAVLAVPAEAIIACFPRSGSKQCTALAYAIEHPRSEQING